MDFTKLTYLLDQVQATITSLQSVGITPESYESFDAQLFMSKVESVNSSFQKNAVYGLIIPQEAGKQLALMAALFSSKLIVEKFMRAV